MKNGFTLVELLAVIVILAVLALIATPVVLSIIDDAKESAMLRSAEMYLSGVENAIMRENMNSGGNFRPTECTISGEGNLDCEGKDGIIEVEVNGEKPKNGSIVFENGKIKEVRLEYETATIIKNEEGNLIYEDKNDSQDENNQKEEVILSYTSLGNFQHKISNGIIENHDTENGICSKCDQQVLESGLYDENDNLVYSWAELLTIEIEVPNYVEEYPNDVLEVYLRGTKIVNVVSVEGGSLTTYHEMYGECKNYKADYLVGKLIIDKSVTKIENYAFEECMHLTSVEIPNSITYIGGSVFKGCTNLISAIIPNSITEISSSTFSGCTNLKSVEILNGVKEIDGHVFEGCTSLTSVTIPDSVISIDYLSFSGCTSLTSIYIPSSVETISSLITVSYSPFYGCSSNLKLYCGSNEKQNDWGTYWNYYSTTETLSVIYGVAREEYEAIVNSA